MFISCQLTINNIINQIPFSLSSIMVEKDIFKLSDCLKVDAKKQMLTTQQKLQKTEMVKCIHLTTSSKVIFFQSL